MRLRRFMRMDFVMGAIIALLLLSGSGPKTTFASSLIDNELANLAIRATQPAAELAQGIVNRIKVADPNADKVMLDAVISAFPDDGGTAILACTENGHACICTGAANCGQLAELCNDASFFDNDSIGAGTGCSQSGPSR